ncbi:regulatory protein ToxS [Vibrio sp. MA40-2]|uniref:regulatory protein ToxS n=1 Tax=Vibrio sp. MA40-2 TaxID=3391828 RepID=UPI0039A668CE
MKNKFFMFWLVAIIMIAFAMFYHKNQFEHSILTSATWHSNMKFMVPNEYYDQASMGLDKLYTTSIMSNFKYLEDKSYIQNSFIEAYGEENNILFTIEISNIGHWRYDDAYLFLEAGDIHDVSSISGNYTDHTNVEKLKELFLIDMLQVRKIDMIDKNTMLMTSVDNTSKLWFSQ